MLFVNGGKGTAENILRKTAYVDEIHFHEGVILPSWLDLNVTELCNRTCEFCPRSDPNSYPNQNLHMSLDLVSKIANELIALNYKGGVNLCGYGEALLYPDLCELVSRFKHKIQVELVTNGDKLDPYLIGELYDAGLKLFCVSLYDGPEQVEKFTDLFNCSGIPEKAWLLRERWFGEDENFGLMLTNRAGTINIGSDPKDFKAKPCLYLAYSIMIDWNGDFLLCCQDWNKKLRFGNLNDSNLFSIWKDPLYSKMRARLIKGDRSKPPCNVCNVKGVVHGYNHSYAWID